MNNVKVLQVEDVEIGKWRWWSDWIDVSVFNYGNYGYLLQMKIDRRNNKKFKTVEYEGMRHAAHANTMQAGDLIPINDKVLKSVPVDDPKLQEVADV